MKIYPVAVGALLLGGVFHRSRYPRLGYDRFPGAFRPLFSMASKLEDYAIVELSQGRPCRGGGGL